MSITCGFYDSLDGDRKYNAEQMSAMFDGLITDGIFATIGTAMAVTASSGTTVNIGIGKAWFNHTWTVNDAPLALELSAAETVLDRIDAVLLEIDASSLVRANSVKVIEGTAASSPVRPTLTNEGKVHQYALAYIYRTAGSKSISQSDITSMVGTDDTPFVTAILETVSLDELLGQWRDELDQFVANKSAEAEQKITDKSDEIDQFIETKTTEVNQTLTAKSNEVDQKLTAKITEVDEKLTTKSNEVDQFVSTKTTEMDTWSANEKADFDTWFANLKTQLTEDAAGNLQNQIDTLSDSVKTTVTEINETSSKTIAEITETSNQTITEIKETCDNTIAECKTTIANAHTAKEFTIPASGWATETDSDEYVCTVTVSGVTAENNINVTPYPEVTNNKLWGKNGVYAASQGVNTITFRAKRQPTEDIKVNVLIIN